MAGAVIVMTGWLFFSGGAAAGSLACARLPDRDVRTEVATPNATLATFCGLILAVNHFRAHRRTKAFRDRGGRDISGFPLEMYAENLALIGYFLSVCVCNAVFSYLNRDDDDGAAAGPPLLRDQVPAASRGRAGLLGAALCILPLPISGPVVLLYIFPISV